MKYLLLGIVALFVLWGGVLVTFKKQNRDDSVAIKRYVKSRGSAPIPVSWRDKIGEGI